MKRQIVLDTETTGLEFAKGHRIIEIGCIEIVSRQITDKNFHCYLNPDRLIEAGAMKVHGITDASLIGQPKFATVADALLDFIKDAEVLIHNAVFDISFLEGELTLMSANIIKLAEHCQITDTLLLARELHPGQRNSLDALCKRYSINNSQRQLHGALLDAELLALVYLAMTSGQKSLFMDGDMGIGAIIGRQPLAVHAAKTMNLPVLMADAEEVSAHLESLQRITHSSGSKCLWQ